LAAAVSWLVASSTTGQSLALAFALAGFIIEIVDLPFAVFVFGKVSTQLLETMARKVPLESLVEARLRGTTAAARPGRAGKVAEMGNAVSRSNYSALKLPGVATVNCAATLITAQRGVVSDELATAVAEAIETLGLAPPLATALSSMITATQPADLPHAASLARRLSARG
jgi:hypothetical protein